MYGWCSSPQRVPCACATLLPDVSRDEIETGLAAPPAISAESLDPKFGTLLDRPRRLLLCVRKRCPGTCASKSTLSAEPCVRTLSACRTGQQAGGAKTEVRSFVSYSHALCGSLRSSVQAATCCGAERFRTVHRYNRRTFVTRFDDHLARSLVFARVSSRPLSKFRSQSAAVAPHLLQRLHRPPDIQIQTHGCLPKGLAFALHPQAACSCSRYPDLVRTGGKPGPSLPHMRNPTARVPDFPPRGQSLHVMFRMLSRMRRRTFLVRKC